MIPDPQPHDLEGLLEGLDESVLQDLIDDLPEHILAALGSQSMGSLEVPPDPASQAVQLDSTYVVRPHLEYLSHRLAQAVSDVESGRNRRLMVSMPPRTGKSTLITLYLVVWLLRKHPDWAFMLTSHEGGLATSWGRAIQRTLLDNPSLGVALARYPSAASEWETTAGGTVLSRGIRGSITGRGARVLVIDDPVKDFVEAHSPLVREATWNWWLSTSQPRLEPPFLVLVVMTRWHEDDFVGRLLSKDREGDPTEWEVIRLPALADSEDDVLQRAIGDPLLSPLLPHETPEQAVERWEEMRRSVGSYAFASMHQQRPAPAKGAIFDSDWWRFWTTDPVLARASITSGGNGEGTHQLNPRVVLVDPAALATARWLDSWDCSFKGADDSDFVVGQRWCRLGANRYLIAQQRGRWTFTQTIEQMEQWARHDSDALFNPYGRHVHERLIEDTANGPAIIDVLKQRITGMIPVGKRASKEMYARAVTPEVEAGHVLLPHPSAPGNGWVHDLLSELRNFPHDAHDDQVDAMTQALIALKDAGRGGVTIPGRLQQTVVRNVAQAAHTDPMRRRAR